MRTRGPGAVGAALVLLLVVSCRREPPPETPRPPLAASVPPNPGTTLPVAASPAPSSNFVGAAPATPPPPGPFVYRLPVVGTWKVHRTHYNADNDQAFAVDLTMLAPGESKSVKLRTSDPPRNEDYAAYDQPLVADGPGVVAIVVDGVPDNVPGVRNGYDMHGNYVVIDHRNGEYSLYAHIIPFTMKVRVGQYVEPGQELGRCGNSGHSTMPHLHWQVMDNVLAHRAKAIVPRLGPYEKNGQASSARLEANDIIRQP